jgi:transcriptional regulator with XRE-family HTH domain
MGVFLLVELGQKLRELRQELGMTQLQVANRIGVTSSIVSAYENDVRQPSYTALIKLATLFRVSTDYLLGVTETRETGNKNVISLDGLTPAKRSLVIQLINTLKE